MIPFEIPDSVLAEVAAGAVRRIGATLRDRATGRIVGHVQETGLLQALIGIAPPAGLVLSAGDLISSITANVQLARIASTLSTLQMLSGAGLAASVVGVGVSAAGFALVLNRLAHVERALAGVHRAVIEAKLVAERVDVRQAAAASRKRTCRGNTLSPLRLGKIVYRFRTYSDTPPASRNELSGLLVIATTAHG